MPVRVTCSDPTFRGPCCRYHIDASHLPIICIIDPRTGLKVRDYDGQTIKADDLATIRKSVYIPSTTFCVCG